MAKILLVEDEAAQANAVKGFLESRGHLVDHAQTVSDAYGFLEGFYFDLLILDWQLGDNHLCGIDILRSYRGSGGSAPVLMLTGMSEIQNKEQGFGSGADDYLTKPFDLRELGLRVDALLKRPTAMFKEVLEVGSLKLDPVKKQATAAGAELQLRPKEFALLEHFMRHPGHTFSCDELLSAVWPSDADGTELAVRLTIKRLRQRIKDASGTDPIETVHGYGYNLSTS